MILYGQYVVAIDEKGKWTVPHVFAPALAEGGIVTAGLDGCLWLYPSASWQAFVERVSPRLALTQSTAREFARYVFGQACSLTLQKSQLELPSSLRQLAAINGKAILVGMIDHIEVWSPDRWQAQLARADSAWEAGLSALGI